MKLYLNIVCSDTCGDCYCNRINYFLNVKVTKKRISASGKRGILKWSNVWKDFKLIVTSCGCKIILGGFEPCWSVVSSQTRGCGQASRLSSVPVKCFTQRFCWRRPEVCECLEATLNRWLWRHARGFMPALLVYLKSFLIKLSRMYI